MDDLTTINEEGVESSGQLVEWLVLGLPIAIGCFAFGSHLIGKGGSFILFGLTLIAFGLASALSLLRASRQISFNRSGLTVDRYVGGREFIKWEQLNSISRPFAWFAVATYITDSGKEKNVLVKRGQLADLIDDDLKKRKSGVENSLQFAHWLIFGVPIAAICFYYGAQNLVKGHFFVVIGLLLFALAALILRSFFAIDRRIVFSEDGITIEKLFREDVIIGWDQIDSISTSEDSDWWTVNYKSLASGKRKSGLFSIQSPRLVNLVSEKMNDRPKQLR